MSHKHDLNSDQIRAVQHCEGPMIVIAGAGSGKTHVVSERVKYLIDKFSGKAKFLVITFTNKACIEIKERIHNIERRDVDVYTFHGLGLNIIRTFSELLGRNASYIQDEGDSVSLLKKIFVEMGIDKAFAKDYFRAISESKSDILFVKQVSQGHLKDACQEVSNKTKLPKFYEVFEKYTEICAFNKSVDFSDMLYLPALLLLKSEIAKDLIKAQWNYVIVDEYQDTSNLEFFVIKCLINDKNNLMVVGDPNQSIYEWRGADIGNILNFRDFAPNVTEVRLSQNYRSSNEILEFSNSIIQNSDANIFKNSLRGTFSSNKPTIVKCGSDISEARYIRNHISNNMTKFDSMAVLYRTNSQSRIIESTLMESGIRYKILGGLSIFQREEIKTMISYLKSWNEEYCDIISLERAISCPRIGIGDVKIQEIFMCCEKFNMGPIECLRNSVLEDNDSEIRKIKLSKKQKLCVSNFLSILDDIKDAYNKNGLYGAFVIIADKTGLKEFYRAKEKGVDKVNNINNLKDLYRFSSISLGDFLDKLYVMGGEERDDTKASVVLSTIHSAKGLEFDSVIVCGVEDGIMPHYSALSIDEELRLLYVALTRAKYELIMTCAHSRMVHGIVQRNSVSRFLKKVSLSMYNRENLYESKY